MKIVKAGYEILTPISQGGMQELQHIEKIARVCYKSENLITEDGESAKKMVKMLINRDHTAMIEHSMLSVKFIVDRGVSHEIVRHRISSFAQESTRYCNYAKDKFHNEITVIRPNFFLDETSKAYSLYQQKTIEERHRHRYEVNNDFRAVLTENGMKLSGFSPDGRIVEMCELPEHPFFIATQAHPELKSRPNRPHPLFRGFIEAAVHKNQKQ